ncbi:beta-lactamase family protein [Ferrimonas sediminicola]|uniref:Beta-lactamase family protein n=1 Tax=Ferrimonas sediminicola TaxID=2569538 RepID=A0A4U1B925_9GAMM|nr:serine hydrolase domain-containing protein [Ferrimonas sediminicola]TKB46492.1 beta-lactamase family protein [Ferrimonas sediminicola]
MKQVIKSKRKLLITVAISSLFAMQPACADQNQPFMSKEQGQATFDAVIADTAEMIKEMNIPGLAVGVIHGSNSYSTGLGVTKVGTDEAVTPDTQFQIGSVTKTFLSTVAMQLSEQGKLDLNARVVDILPWWRVSDPGATSKARVVDLFHHRAGWYGDHGFLRVPPGGSISEKVMLQAAYVEQIYPFDQTWMYNNTSITFATHVVSHVGGKPIETLIEDNLLAPLGMNASSFNYDATPPAKNYAWGHPPIYGEGSISDLKPYYIPLIRESAASGALRSTVADMLKYARFQLDGKDASGKQLLSKEALDYAHAPAVEASTGDFTGLTWFVHDYDGVTSPSHGGNWPGTRSFLQLIPDRDFAVVVLVHSDRGVEAYKKVANAMVKAFTKIESNSPVAAGVDPSVLDPFVGVFKGNSQNIEIRKEDDKYVFVQFSALTKGADPAPANVANTAEGYFIITEGPNKGALGELLKDSSGELNYVRFNHRIFIRGEGAVDEFDLSGSVFDE